MESKLTNSKTVRTLATFLCGMAALLLLMQLGSWQDRILAITGLLIEVGTFLLVGILGCALSPSHPFRAGFTVAIGVFVGTVFDVIVHPTFNGFERNLFPLEIAFHTFMAAFCFSLCAVVWKIGSHFFASGRFT
jgi:hypothetical protein